MDIINHPIPFLSFQRSCREARSSSLFKRSISVPTFTLPLPAGPMTSWQCLPLCKGCCVSCSVESRSKCQAALFTFCGVRFTASRSWKRRSAAGLIVSESRQFELPSESSHILQRFIRRHGHANTTWLYIYHTEITWCLAVCREHDDVSVSLSLLSFQHPSCIAYLETARAATTALNSAP